MSWKFEDIPENPSVDLLHIYRMPEDPEEFQRLIAEFSGQGFWPVHEVGRNADYFDLKAGHLVKAGWLLCVVRSLQFFA